jgi:hypothetical protein
MSSSASSAAAKKKVNKQRKATAQTVFNDAAARVAWSKIGLQSIPSASIKHGHSN